MNVLDEAEKNTPGLGVALRPVFFSDIMLSTAEENTWKIHREKFQEKVDKEEADRKARKTNV
jgi:hypothetical protein